MQKQHIFLYPFYYVDYAMAQIGAFEFYTKMKADRKAAWADYYKLCQAGGSMGYFQALRVQRASQCIKGRFRKGSPEAVLEELEV